MISFCSKDSDGLYIVEGDSEIVSIYEKVFELEAGDNGEWHKIPVLNDLVEALLSSRQARRVVLHWLRKNSGEKKAEKKKAREACVLKLLSITPSAIYLRY